MRSRAQVGSGEEGQACRSGGLAEAPTTARMGLIWWPCCPGWQLSGRAWAEAGCGQSWSRNGG